MEQAKIQEAMANTAILSAELTSGASGFINPEPLPNGQAKTFEPNLILDKYWVPKTEVGEMASAISNTEVQSFTLRPFVATVATKGLKASKRTSALKKFEGKHVVVYI